MRPPFALALIAAAALAGCGGSDDGAAQERLVEQGKQIFRYETFGDEAMHWAVLRQVLGETPAVPHAFMS